MDPTPPLAWTGRRRPRRAGHGRRAPERVLGSRVVLIRSSYARVSKTDGSQSLDLQRDALRAESVNAVNLYHDFASGVRDNRPGLHSYLRALRKGDVLVVWKLDRLGRNLAPSLSVSLRWQPHPPRCRHPAGARQRRAHRPPTPSRSAAADRHDVARHRPRRPRRFRAPPATRLRPVTPRRPSVGEDWQRRNAASTATDPGGYRYAPAQVSIKPTSPVAARDSEVVLLFRTTG